MSDLDDFKATYFDECSELLNELEEQFAAIEAGERDPPTGSTPCSAPSTRSRAVAERSASPRWCGFAHAYETLLDHVRDGRVELSDSGRRCASAPTTSSPTSSTPPRPATRSPPTMAAEEKAQFDALARGERCDDDDGEHVEEFDIDFVPVMVDLGTGDEPTAGERRF